MNNKATEQLMLNKDLKCIDSGTVSVCYTVLVLVWTQVGLEFTVTGRRSRELFDIRLTKLKLNFAHYLQINHVPGKRNLWVLPSVHSGNVGFLDLLLHKPCSRGTTLEERSFDFFSLVTIFIYQYLLNFLSISSHLLTSFTNLRWKTFMSGLSCGEKW